MSLNSVQGAETALLERYAQTFGRTNVAFQRGEGVTWAKLKSDIDAEVNAERREADDRRIGRKPRSHAVPYTSAQAAGLFKVHQKRFVELARAESPAGRLSDKPGEHVVVGLVRLLEWAACVPALAGWRAFREDGQRLGRRSAAEESLLRYMSLTKDRIAVRSIRAGGENGPEAIQVVEVDLGAMSSPVRALFLDLLQRAEAVQVDVRNVPMALMSATLPATFSMPWTNEALKEVWVERFKHVVRELQSHMGRRESELWDTLRAMTAHGEEEGTAPDQLLSDGLRAEASELQQAQAHARALLMGLGLPAALEGGGRTPFRF
jgi:hypothetical protein